MLKWILRAVIGLVLMLLLSILGLMIFVDSISYAIPPHAENVLDSTDIFRSKGEVSRIGRNWFRKSESGLYELYAEGDPFERGVAIGLLGKELLQYQEKVFNDEIIKIVPSDLYRECLRYFVGWFNRNLDDNVNDEYKLEIYGMSGSSSANYNNIASPYHRILNYHAAHDLGHALQNMSLVGCTSFATWNSNSEDSALIVGRNFDFYVGDNFAKNKIIAFYNPSQGHQFMMVTFGGMAGVLSGMNIKGLTVTINAAKSEIPSGSATPVSLVAREILQYASSIDEAFAIAKKRKMFVSESFLIGSAIDKRAAIIEKSDKDIALYNSENDYLICTNHFQSKLLGETKLNMDHMKSSASVYRYKRVEELLRANGPNNVKKTVALLRNKEGLKDTPIGLGNEKAVNQLIAHHAIVFRPQDLKVWVSTSPWQLGKFVCYDLKTIFDKGEIPDGEVYDRSAMIPADSFLMRKEFEDFLKIAKFRSPFSSKEDLNPDSIIRWNDEWYFSYMLAGDHYYNKGDYESSALVYQKALTKEIASIPEKEYIEKRLKASMEKRK
jgi:isopenicillin-N N-acyltransferase-like protein